MSLAQVKLSEQNTPASSPQSDFTHELKVTLAARYASGPIREHIAEFLKIFLAKSLDDITRSQACNALTYWVAIKRVEALDLIKERLSYALSDLKEAWELDITPLEAVDDAAYDSARDDGMPALGPTLVRDKDDASSDDEALWEPHPSLLDTAWIEQSDEVDLEAVAALDDEEDEDYYLPKATDGEDELLDAPLEADQFECDLYDIDIVDDEQWQEANPTLVRAPICSEDRSENPPRLPVDDPHPNEVIDLELDAKESALTQGEVAAIDGPPFEVGTGQDGEGRVFEEALAGFRAEMREIADNLRMPQDVPGLVEFQNSMSNVLTSLSQGLEQAHIGIKDTLERLDDVPTRGEHEAWQHGLIKKISEAASKPSSDKEIIMQVQRKLDGVMEEQALQSKLLKALVVTQEVPKPRAFSVDDEERLDHAIQTVLERGSGSFD